MLRRWNTGRSTHLTRVRIDGALQPWTDGVVDTLLEMFPLPAGVEMIPATVMPPPRVSLKLVPQANVDDTQDPLKIDLQYHKGTVKKNQRITAGDWYQDVRHLEIEFGDNVR